MLWCGVVWCGVVMPPDLVGKNQKSHLESPPGTDKYCEKPCRCRFAPGYSGGFGPVRGLCAVCMPQNWGDKLPQVLANGCSYLCHTLVLSIVGLTKLFHLHVFSASVLRAIS